MAKPIGATPVLSGKDATQFIARMQQEANNKVGLMPTPKLKNVNELIRQYGNKKLVR